MNAQAKTRECKECKGILRVYLRDVGHCDIGTGQKSVQGAPIQGANVSVFEWKSDEWRPLTIGPGPQVTDENGCVEFELPGGESHQYGVGFDKGFGFHKRPGEYGDVTGPEEPFTIDCNCTKQINLGVPVNLSQRIVICGPRSEITPCQDIVAGRSVLIQVRHNAALGKLVPRFSASQGGVSQSRSYLDNNGDERVYEASWDTSGMEGPYSLTSSFQHPDGSSITDSLNGLARKDVLNVDARTTTSLTRTETEPTEDLSLWTVIRNSTEALSFNNYLRFMDYLFCGKRDLPDNFEARRFVKKEETYGKLRGHAPCRSLTPMPTAS